MQTSMILFTALISVLQGDPKMYKHDLVLFV